MGMRFTGGLITGVEPTSWAQLNGISVGDQIVEVGGQNVEALDHKELVALLKGSRPLTIVLRQLKKRKQQANVMNQFNLSVPSCTVNHVLLNDE